MKKLLYHIEKVEQWVISLILALLILLASYQIGLRWFTSGGAPWIDPLLRYLVLWGGFLGAVLATSRAQHISLDAIGYLIPDRFKPWLMVCTRCFSAVVAFFLFRAALMFLKSEIEFGGTSLFNLPTWLWYLIFPLSFGMISFHFMLSAFLTLFDKTEAKHRFSKGVGS